MDTEPSDGFYDALSEALPRVGAASQRRICWFQAVFTDVSSAALRRPRQPRSERLPGNSRQRRLLLWGRRKGNQTGSIR